MQAKDMLLIGAAFAAGFALTKIGKQDRVNMKTFIEEALAKSASEINHSKLALEKSQSTNIKIFAQRMIEDHISLNQQLTELAQKYDLSIPDLEKQANTTRIYRVEFKNEELFDQEYVNHQLNSHRDMIKLFRLIGRSEDPEIRNFLSRVLDQLSHHLRMAQELAESFHSNNIPTTPISQTDFVEEPDYKV